MHFILPISGIARATAALGELEGPKFVAPTLPSNWKMLLTPTEGEKKGLTTPCEGKKIAGTDYPLPYSSVATPLYQMKHRLSINSR